MTRRQKIILALLIAAVVTGFALMFCSHRAPRREMRELAPADSAVYLETSNLPQIFQALTENETWRELAPQFGIDFYTNFEPSPFAWLFVSDALKIAERGQFAVVLDGFEAAEAADSLSLKPRLTIIADTHSSEAVNIAEFEKMLTEYASANFQNAVQTRATDDFKWTIWRDGASEKRLFLAVRQNLVYLGNDESAVKKCLAVVRGDAPNLLQNQELSDLREEMNASDALAYGFVAPNGIKQTSELLTLAYAGQVVENDTARSILAETAPKIIQNFAQSVGWTMRRTDEKKIEDTFFIKNPPRISENLREPLQTSVDVTSELGRFVPEESVGFSLYNLQSPLNAWNGLVRETARPLDAVGAIFVTQNAKLLLEPYGIVQPNEFFAAVGSEILTVQTDERDEAAGAVFRVRNAEKLRAEVFKSLATNAPQRLRIDEYEILSNDEDEYSAAFIGNFLVTGDAVSVRKCVETYVANRPLAVDANAMRRKDFAPFVRTFAGDENASDFVRVFAKRELKEKKVSPAPKLTSTETSWRKGGFQRTTISDFGVLGKIVVALDDK